MSKAILEMRRERQGLIQKAQHLFDIAKGENRQFTDDERGDYDGFMERIEALAGDIKRAEQLAELNQETRNGEMKPQGNEDSKIGMGRTDMQNYSIMRAINASAAARRGERNPWKGAELEWEANQAVAQRTGIDPQGFFVPSDILIAKRDLNVGTGTAGGNLVATDLLAQSFIELLRNRVILAQAGATMLTGLVGNVDIPKQTGGATAYWVGEGSSPTESQQTVGQVSMTPHTVGAFTDMTRRLLKQSSIDVEMFVRNDLTAVLALAIDYAGLHGDSGVDANQPDGVEATSGIGSVVGGTNGAAPDWADIVDLETAVSAANADVGALAYITNANVRGKLKQTEKATNTAQFIWADTEMNGYTAHVTNQVRSDRSKGTGTDLSTIFFGNWADLLIGMWGGLDIMVDPYTASTSGTVRVVALQDVDIAVRHAESFAAMLDAITA